MSWPLAIMVSVAMVVIGVTALFDRDIGSVSAAITTILIALGLAELREIKTNTNGNNNNLLEQNKALMAEIAQYRRDAMDITNRAMDSNSSTTPQGPGQEAPRPPTLRPSTPPYKD